MRHYELPPEEAKKLVNSEKAASWKFKLIYVGVAIAVCGAAAFALAFFYQNPLNEAGLPYRQVQMAAIVVVFLGWLIFQVFCRTLGINTRNLSYNKLVSILKNQVETPFDELKALRKQLSIALLSLNDDWALFRSVFADDPHKHIPAVLSGPGGIFAIHPVFQNPRKNDFVDPAPSLLLGSAELQSRLKQPVTPIVAFLRNKKHYSTDNEGLKIYTLQELLAHIESRQTVLDMLELQQVESKIRYLANLPRNAVEISNSKGRVVPAAARSIK